MLEIELADAAATEALGARVAGAVVGGRAVVLLDGALGAGKTCFSRGFLRACGVEGPIASPTYALVHSYAGALSHADVYRLDDTDALERVGLLDDVERGVWLIEWASRFPEVWPDDHLAVRIEAHGAARRATLRASGPVHQALLARVRA